MSDQFFSETMSTSKFHAGKKDDNRCSKFCDLRIERNGRRDLPHAVWYHKVCIDAMVSGSFTTVIEQLFTYSIRNIQQCPAACTSVENDVSHVCIIMVSCSITRTYYDINVWNKRVENIFFFRKTNYGYRMVWYCYFIWYFSAVSHNKITFTWS